MTNRSSGKAPSRRAVLQAGLGGLAAAGVAAAGMATPARAATARPRVPAAPAGIGTAGGLTWSGWSRTAQGIFTNDAMACLADGVVAGSGLWLIATGTDSRIYFNTSNDAQNWSGWSEVPGGGRTTGAPTVGLGPDRQLVISVTGLDNAIWLNSTSDGVNWTGWFSIGGQTFSTPLLAESTKVFVPGTDGEIFVNSTTNLQNFSGWQLVPGNGITNDAMCLNGFNFSGVGGANVLFAIGTDDRIYYNPVDVTSGISTSIIGKWTEVPGNGFSDAAPTIAAVPGDDFIDAVLFVKGAGNQSIFVNRASGYPNFGGWEVVPGGGATNVALCATLFADESGSVSILLFAVGTDGTPWVNVGG